MEIYVELGIDLNQRTEWGYRLITFVVTSRIRVGWIGRLLWPRPRLPDTSQRETREETR